MYAPAVQNFGNVTRQVTRVHETDKTVPVVTSLRATISVKPKINCDLPIESAKVGDVARMQK